MGDALMAIWGAPFAHPDDTDRALDAAVEMQRALVAWNSQRASTQRLAVHMGLNTGRVAVGNIGSDRYLQYAAIGDTTNVTSRICNVAQEGEIVISQSTLDRLNTHRWPLEPLPPVKVKGKEEPLQLYRVDWKVGC
jgi:adenylate cyclase